MLNKPAPRPETRAKNPADVPTDLADLIMSCLEKNPLDKKYSKNADSGFGLAVSEVQGLVLTINSTDPRVSEFTMVTSGGDSILPSNGGTTYKFAVPSLSADDSLRLITPENYDGNFVVSIESLVTVNGNSALSSPITMGVDVFSDGTPADVRFGEAEAFEDGPAFRLPVNVTLTDKSESP